MHLGTQTDKLKALTGLRFVAAGLIVMHHAGGFHVQVPPLALDHGVSLFFVLSGFILVHVYPKLESWSATKTFLALRIARIWPAHAVTLIVAAMLFQPVIDGKFIANLLMVQGWIPSGPWYFSFNAVSWSISTEFFFYLAFPLLIWKWNKTLWWKWLAAGGLIVTLCAFAISVSMPPGYSAEDLVTVHGLLFINPLARLLEFVTGMVAYAVFVWLKPRMASFKARSPILSVATMSCTEVGALALAWYFLFALPMYHCLLRYIGSGPWLEWCAHAGSFPAFGLLIIVFGLGMGYASRALSTRYAVFLGEISYSVYLLHLMVYNIYTRYWPQQAHADYLGLSLCVAVTLILSIVLWKTIEVPCRLWVKNRAATPLRPRPSVRSVSVAEATLPTDIGRV